MMQSSTSSAPTARGRQILIWTLQILLAAAFLAAGVCKLIGLPMMVETFTLIGFGQWFRYLTGALEIAGAVALLVPGLAAFGAVLLGAVMVGATTAHLLILPTPAAPAIVLLLLCITVAALRREQIAGFLDRV